MKKSWVVLVGEYTSLGLLLPVSTIVGYAIGYMLDKWFGTHFLYLVFLLLGIAAGLIKLIQQVQRDTNGNNES